LQKSIPWFFYLLQCDEYAHIYMNKKDRSLHSALFIFRVILISIICIFTHRYSFGETLFFEDVIGRVIANSYDIQISRIDKQIGRHKRSQAMAQYLPVVSIRLNDEYYKDLTHPNDTIIHTDVTGFKNYLSFNADYNLFDFGAREMRYINASRDIKIAEYAITQQLIDTKTNTLFVYKKGLTLSKK
jgi:hypothetical protein